MPASDGEKSGFAIVRILGTIASLYWMTIRVSHYSVNGPSRGPPNPSPYHLIN